MQAGLRAVHDLGPEIRRAISGNLDEEDFAEKDAEEPMHRVCNEINKKKKCIFSVRFLLCVLGLSASLDHCCDMLYVTEDPQFVWQCYQSCYWRAQDGAGKTKPTPQVSPLSIALPLPPPPLLSHTCLTNNVSILHSFLLTAEPQIVWIWQCDDSLGRSP